MGSKFMSGKRTGQVLRFALLALCLSASWGGAQEPVNHKVEKGDTLWSISEQYFGKPDLWPSLWEMNPFVTNPHLLKPGDMIRVGMQQPAAAQVTETPATVAPRPVEIPKPKTSGIHVGAITKLNARGLLSRGEEQPLTVVQGADSQTIFLTKGDLIFLNFANRPGVKTGDEFMIFRPVSPVSHILTGDNMGTLYSARGKAVLKERSINAIYQAQIQENYLDVKLGDLVFPYTPIPSCLTPLASDPALRGVVVAAQQMQTSFGRNSIVYLDSGRDKGLFPGSMLELVRFRNIPDPAVSTEPSALLYELFKVKTLAELIEKVNRESQVYEKMVGRMIVLDVGPQTATALVLSTNETLRVGAFFRGASSWLDSPGSSQGYAPCPVQP
jgi:hypothetical protein